MVTFEREPIEISDLEIGRIPDLGIVRLDIALTRRGWQGQTVTHEDVDGYWRFSVSASVWQRRNSTDCHMAGQIRSTVRLLGPTTAELCRLWKRWHLNDMRAGCAHQGQPRYTATGSADLDSVEPCPKTGYRYGSAWLVEVIPQSELDAIGTMVQSLRSP